jgi:hypothetical protein
MGELKELGMTGLGEGVPNESLIFRLGREEGELSSRESYVRVLAITSSPMNGWVTADLEGIAAGSVVQSGGSD